MNIATGDYFYFQSQNIILIVVALAESKARLRLAKYNEDAEESVHLSFNFIEKNGRYLGNSSVTPYSQLPQFYPELFI